MAGKRRRERVEDGSDNVFADLPWPAEASFAKAGAAASAV